MSGFCVQDAPIRRLNASKTISKRKPPPTQTWPSEGLGGSVVRRPGKQNQSSWPLRRNFKGAGGSHAGATAPAGQPRFRGYQQALLPQQYGFAQRAKGQEYDTNGRALSGHSSGPPHLALNAPGRKRRRVPVSFGSRCDSAPARQSLEARHPPAFDEGGTWLGQFSGSTQDERQPFAQSQN